LERSLLLLLLPAAPADGGGVSSALFDDSIRSSKNATTKTTGDLSAASNGNYGNNDEAAGEAVEDGQRQQTRPDDDRQLKLRFDWTALQQLSPLARRIRTHQRDCSLPLADFRYRNRYGLGSDLHVWTQAACNAVQADVRVRTLLSADDDGGWTYYDGESCNNNSDSSNDYSAMLCYFPRSEMQCPGDVAEVQRQSRLDGEVNRVLEADSNAGIGASSIVGNRTSAHPSLPSLRRQQPFKLYKRQGVVSREGCREFMAASNYTYSDVRAAGVEYLFTAVSPLVAQEAERQLRLVFAGNGAVPSDLITVQIRWGDKHKEMKLATIEEYVEAVETILAERKNRQRDALGASEPTNAEPVSIFLATEDPRAVDEFRRAALQRNWTVYVDAYFAEYLPYRNSEYNGNPKMSRRLRGRPGLAAIASLLVALEADDYVLTTASNWSRLVNELRKNVLHPRCGNCTRMIDLRPGEW